MTKSLRPIFLFLLAFLALSIFLPETVQAEPAVYTVLEPDFITQGEADNVTADLFTYGKFLFNMIFTVIVIAALFQFIRGALSYMLSSVPFLKFEGKSLMFNALWGLLLALSSYLILYTINPQLVNWSIDFGNKNPAPNSQP